MKAEELYEKEFGNADSIPKESVLRLLNNFARALKLEREKALRIHDVIASASFKNDLEKAIEMGENVGFNEDGGYDYFSQSDAFEAVVAVLKKHLL